MQQLLYISTARHSGGDPVDQDEILAVSRSKNGRNGVTGLLLYDGTRFLQVLEGEERAVSETFERIRQDPRHFAIVILARRDIVEREFGGWSMACQRRDEDPAATIRRIADLSADANPMVQATFQGLAELRRAA